MGENISNHTSDKGLIYRQYKELKKFSNNKIKIPAEKSAKDVNMQRMKYKWPTDTCKNAQEN